MRIFLLTILACCVSLIHTQAPRTMPQSDNSDCICRYGDPVCYCDMVIEPRLTLLLGRDLVYPDQGILRFYNGSALTQAQADRVITADGERSRLVIAINEKFPGPRIEVFENQTLEVKIVNLHHTDSVTVHFHGLHQLGTPWMDGVAFITQCPIMPGQTFVHRFRAFPPGSGLYHAHIGDQRSQGLYGPLIVRTNPNIRRLDEIVITLQDWNHLMDAETAYYRMISEQFDLPTGEIIPTTSSIDGGQFSRFEFQSGLINGKGRFWYNKTTHNGAPLERFVVNAGQTYYFRVISANTLYPMRVYIEGSKLTLKASDAFDLDFLTVQSIILHPGERYDFQWTAPSEPTRKEVLLVAQTLETDASLRGVKYHAAEAVIEFANHPGDSNPNPTNNQVENCSEVNKCRVFNCPFGNYGSLVRTCLNFNDATNNDPIRSPNRILGDSVDEEYFFNFAFPGTPGNTPGSVNGRQFIFPTGSMLTQADAVSTPCDESVCRRDGICECTYTQEIGFNRLIQMTFLNLGVGSGWSHPVHLHGHSFYVMKMGLGTYNETSGMLLQNSDEISCTDGRDYCTNATWTNSSWLGGQVPDLNPDPPEKDTVVVPTGGYVVIRFISDNPGLWFLHCHIDLHNTNGMGMLINEAPANRPATPAGFPTCRNFMYNGQSDDMDETRGVDTSNVRERTNGQSDGGRDEARDGDTSRVTRRTNGQSDGGGDTSGTTTTQIHSISLLLPVFSSILMATFV